MRFSLTTKLSELNFLKIIIIFIIVFPVFKSSLPQNQGYFLLIILQAFLCFFYTFLYRKPLSKLSIYIAFALTFIWSLSIFTSERPAIRDIFELSRPILYALSFNIGFSLKKEYKIEIINFLINFTFLFLFIHFINLIFQFSPGFAGLYSSEELFTKGRFLTPFSSPYDLAFIVTLMFSVYFAKFLQNKKNILINLFCIIFCSLFLLYSQSRTGFFGLLISIIIISFDQLINIRNLVKKRILLLFAFILSIPFIFSTFIFSGQFDYMTKGIEKIFLGESVGSLNVRFEQLNNAFLALNNLRNIFFGFGPGFGLPEVFNESQYALYLYRYGLITFIICILFFSITIIASYKKFNWISRYSDENEFKTILLALFSWLFAVPIMCLTNSYLDIARISFVYFFIAGYVINPKILNKNP